MKNKLTKKLEHWLSVLKKPRRKRFYVGPYKDMGKASRYQPGSVRRAACWFICSQTSTKTLAFFISIRICFSRKHIASGTGFKFAMVYVSSVKHPTWI